MTTRRYYQGLWDFSTFSSYWSEWLVPYVLGDLETVTEGSLSYWTAKGEPDAGRGDFLIATTLFALLEHVGDFLGHPNDRRGGRVNISRSCHLLESTRNIPVLVGLCGRNALVHRAWPETTVVMDDGAWAFGLNVTANPDETDHRKTYWGLYDAPGKPSQLMPVLKYRLNMRVLRRELDALLRDRRFPQRVDPARFDRVRQEAIDDCWRPFGEQTRDHVRRDAIAEIRSIRASAPAMDVSPS